MGFTAVTAEEMTAAIADTDTARELAGAHQRPGFAYLYLDKSWDGIRYLMRAAGMGIDLFADGASLGEDGTLSGWSVEDIAEAAAVVTPMPFADLRGWYNPKRMLDEDVYPEIWESDWAKDYVLNYYRDLREFFMDTAEKRRAALMSWG